MTLQEILQELDVLNELTNDQGKGMITHLKAALSGFVRLEDIYPQTPLEPKPEPKPEPVAVPEVPKEEKVRGRGRKTKVAK